MMAFGLVADDERTLDRFTKSHMNQMGATGSPAAYRKAKATKGNWIVGLTNEVVDKLGKFASDEVPEYRADGIAPRVAGL
jgi:hypothetical protein